METTNYKRIILPQAEADIRDVLQYISNELCNPDAANKLLTDMIEAMESVSMFPNSRPKLNDKKLTADNEYRRIDVNNFVLIYKVVEEVREIRVMACLYAPSDVISRLIKRL